MRIKYFIEGYVAVIEASFVHRLGACVICDSLSGDGTIAFSCATPRMACTIVETLYEVGKIDLTIYPTVKLLSNKED